MAANIIESPYHLAAPTQALVEQAYSILAITARQCKRLRVDAGGKRSITELNECLGTRKPRHGLRRDRSDEALQKKS